MKLSTSLVAVKKIKSNVPCSNFSNDTLEKLANLILKAEGIIKPIILRRTSLESYEVVDGDLEYYAAARAKEIEPRKGEMIGAFIIEPENEEIIIEQIELLKSVEKPNSKGKLTEEILVNMESRFTNFESRVEKRFSDLQSEYKCKFDALNNQLEEFKKHLPKPIDPLKAINTLSQFELNKRLNKAGIKTVIIERIIDERNSNGNFSSCGNVINRVKGLGEKTMIKIIDILANSLN
jgi:hypothetical protein